MIVSLFTELGGWSWLILGLILLMVEILASGTFFLWLASPPWWSGLRLL